MVPVAGMARPTVMIKAVRNIALPTKGPVRRLLTERQSRKSTKVHRLSNNFSIVIVLCRSISCIFSRCRMGTGRCVLLLGF